MSLMTTVPPRYVLDADEQQALLERFLRYVKIDTQSDEHSPAHPSTEKQKDLARILVAELGALGCVDVTMADSGHVYATMPANLPAASPVNLAAGHPSHEGLAGNWTGPVPPLGFLAHLDTYPGTCGAGVRPMVVDRYAGGDIVLPATGESIATASHPNLARCLGHTLIHTDGTTLLGADDKAGVAEIMTMVAWLADHPAFQHGKLCLAFTPDEEIGRGIELFNLSTFGARYAYTVDGSELGEVEDETFSADTATLTITGHDVHPGQAKNVMVNAVRVASALVAALPTDFLPETTEGRQPYLHPYLLTGDVARAQLKLLVRAFSTHELHERENVLRHVVAGVGARFPGASITLEVTEGYRNMAEHIAKDPKVIDYAVEAVRRQGLSPVRKPVRGGTDGSRLSALGLLTPNIFTGGQAAHSVREWISLQWMAAAVGVCLQLVNVWVEKSRDS